MTETERFETIRALAFAMPLSILAGAVIAPPTAILQLLVVAVALAIAWPLSRRIVANDDVRTRTLATFFLVIAAVVLVGLWILAGTSLDGAAAQGGRAVVVVVGVGLGYGLVVAGIGRR